MKGGSDTVKRTIELNQESERQLEEWRRFLGTRSEEEALESIADFFLRRFQPGRDVISQDSSVRLGNKMLQWDLKCDDEFSRIRSSPGIMGGDACVRNTRIPVWLLVAHKKDGFGDGRILANFPQLSAADLIAAWDYYASHMEQIEAERAQHEETD